MLTSPTPPVLSIVAGTPDVDGWPNTLPRFVTSPPIRSQMEAPDAPAEDEMKLLRYGNEGLLRVVWGTEGMPGSPAPVNCVMVETPPTPWKVDPA